MRTAAISDIHANIAALEADRQRLRGLLLEGASSRLTPPLDDAFFDDMRERVCGRNTASPDAAAQ
jgi:hypothetical protein